jgi:hypothetical protein
MLTKTVWPWYAERPFIFIVRVFKNTKWISRAITAKLDPSYLFPTMQNILPQPAAMGVLYLSMEGNSG